MPAGRKSHARKDGESKVWVVLRAPEEMLRAIDRDEAEVQPNPDRECLAEVPRRMDVRMPAAVLMAVPVIITAVVRAVCHGWPQSQAGARRRRPW